VAHPDPVGAGLVARLASPGPARADRHRHTIETRPTSLTAGRYRQSPWRPLIETAGSVLARGRERGAAIEEVVATIWAALEQARVDTASDAGVL
jgi:hypothetical protein